MAAMKRIDDEVRLTPATVEGMARSLCAEIFQRGKTGGHYAVPLDEAARVLDLPFHLAMVVTTFAMQSFWMRASRTTAALTAAGLHVGKHRRDGA